jgi:hypothetical protein
MQEVSRFPVIGRVPVTAVDLAVAADAMAADTAAADATVVAIDATAAHTTAADKIGQCGLTFHSCSR